MANKFLDVLSDKISIKNNKLTINDIGLSGLKKYQLIASEGAITDKNGADLSSVISFSFSTAKSKPITTPSGRKIYRHSSDEGSVIEFDMYGNSMQMFVADKKYWFLDQFNNYPAGGSNGYRLNMGYYASKLDPLFSKNDEIVNLPDSELQNKITLVKRSDEDSLFAENQCTRAAQIISQSRTPCAINRVRNLKIIKDDNDEFIKCDIPTAYELAVICIEGDTLASLDPTSQDTFTSKCTALSNQDSSPFLFNISTKQRCTVKGYTLSCCNGVSNGLAIRTHEGSWGSGYTDGAYWYIPIKELGIN